MEKFWMCIFLLLSLSAKSQDWLKTSIPSDLDHTCLIIEKIDSVGPRCKEGKRLFYCSDFDRNIDKLLPTLQKAQESIFMKYEHEYIMVLPKAFPYQEYADLKDINKFRYILRIHFYPPSDGKNDNPTWIYYFYDRKTQKAYPRIYQLQDVKFKNTREFIDALNKKFESNQK